MVAKACKYLTIPAVIQKILPKFTRAFHELQAMRAFFAGANAKLFAPLRRQGSAAGAEPLFAPSLLGMGGRAGLMWRRDHGRLPR
ncbi:MULTISPECIES: hypothetical protein [unclassified Bradyrhizobium]|uniref:hypothetical protein n=1 Tax=unclassified Bradyrhizobium TaxID=2631580 RepID=UPI0029168070|nr:MULTISPECIES: hypothetical protein [unclassified Bradyrhizobium]